MDPYGNPLDLASQEEQASAKRTLDTQQREQFEQDLKWFLAHKQGRRIMWRWISEVGVFQPVYRPDAMEMSFAEGRRNVGLSLLNEILAVTPDSFTLMMKEAHDDARKRNARSDLRNG